MHWDPLARPGAGNQLPSRDLGVKHNVSDEIQVLFGSLLSISYVINHHTYIPHFFSQKATKIPSL